MRVFAIAASALSLALVAVGVAAMTAVGGGNRGATVRVTLREMVILNSPKRVSAGRVTFGVRNVGTIEHELVVVRDNGSGRLPVRNYKAEEGNRVVGEVEVAPGRSGRFSVSLKPGKYLLICNIVGHYQLGMAARLRAT